MNATQKTLVAKLFKGLAAAVLATALAWLQANYVGAIQGMTNNAALASFLTIAVRMLISVYDAYKTA